MDAREKIDAAAYKAAEKLETAGESFGDTVRATNDTLTDKFGDATDKFADKLQKITHQGEYANTEPADGEGEHERGFMDKVNGVLDTLADKLPIGGAEMPPAEPRR